MWNLAIQIKRRAAKVCDAPRQKFLTYMKAALCVATQYSVGVPGDHVESTTR